VAFTGSTEVARLIARTLAGKDGPLVPLIAETGGQNALIADSSALPEQIVRDVVASAFNSAGQRCSALRVLFIQADIADRSAKCSPARCRNCASATRPTCAPTSAR
jgi:RHH-type proline utilization regulon transcriptional repressor/proline dehydrogenase/delta 1-pyrroline-5-carboxylate dehydrogenase